MKRLTSIIMGVALALAFLLAALGNLNATPAYQTTICEYLWTFDTDLEHWETEGLYWEGGEMVIPNGSTGVLVEAKIMTVFGDLLPSDDLEFSFDVNTTGSLDFLVNFLYETAMPESFSFMTNGTYTISSSITGDFISGIELKNLGDDATVDNIGIVFPPCLEMPTETPTPTATPTITPTATPTITPTATLTPIPTDTPTPTPTVPQTGIHWVDLPSGDTAIVNMEISAGDIIVASLLLVIVSIQFYLVIRQLAFGAKAR